MSSNLTIDSQYMKSRLKTNPNFGSKEQKFIISDPVELNRDTCKDVVGDIKITNVVFNGGMRINGRSLNNVKFFDCEFGCEEEESLSINKNDSSIRLSSCTITGHAYLHQINNEVLIQNSHFESRVEFISSRGKLVFYHDLIHKNKSIDQLVIHGGTGNVNIINYTVDKIDVKQFGGNITQQNGKVGEFLFQNINEAQIEIKGESTVEQARVGLFALYKEFHHTKVNVLFCEIETLWCEDISTLDGSLTLQSTNVNKVVNFSGTDLSDCKFFNVSLRGDACLDNVILNNTYLSGIKWPKQHKVKHVSELRAFGLSAKSSHVVQVHQQKKEVYRQLKAISLYNQNNTDALTFYRNELAEYYEYAKASKEVNLEDRFILWVNRWSSNFNQSFLLPLMWLFVFHSILFILLIIGNYEGSRILFHGNISTFHINEASAMYLRMLLPTHAFPDNMSGWVTIVDLLMRIFSGFFIYKIIRSSRKFARI